MTIFLVGGGTGGPTAPVLAVAEAILRKNPKVKLYFLATKNGIDRTLADASGLPMTFLRVPAGKWRRYFSVLNFFDIFKIVGGIFVSFYFIKKYKPDLVFGAGSFVQVPVVLAAWLAGVPSVIHQQDFGILLSTRLATPFADAVTVSFADSAKYFAEGSGMFRQKRKSKVFYTGNPVRPAVLNGDAEEAKKIFGLVADYPTLLVLGGAGGAGVINDLVADALPQLSRYVQIIHVTGGKTDYVLKAAERYHPFDFLTHNLKHAYAAADIVLSRAGLSTISELSRLAKPAILVPLPGSHQISNAKYLALNRAALCIPQSYMTADFVVQLVRKLLWDKKTLDMMRQNIVKLMPTDADDKIVKILWKTIDQK